MLLQFLFTLIFLLFLFFPFFSSFPAAGVDYLSTIKRDNSGKTGEGLPKASEGNFAPKTIVPAYATMTLKPVPVDKKKEGVPVDTAPVNVQKNVTINTSAPVLTKVIPSSPTVTISSSDTTFSYDLLKTAPPDGIDLSNKEAYLTAPIFLSVFEMDAKSFEALPKWKKDLIKKKVGLF